MNERFITEAQVRELEELYQQPVITICAWCRKYLYGYGEEISHGICADCAEIHFPQTYPTDTGLRIREEIELLDRKEQPASLVVIVAGVGAIVAAILLGIVAVGMMIWAAVR